MVAFEKHGLPTLLADKRCVTRCLWDEQGVALVAVLLITFVVFGIGALAVAVAGPETRIAGNFQNGVAARIGAEARIDEIVGLHNNTTVSPRFLLNPATYSATTATSATLPTDTIRAPYSSGTVAIGTLETQVTNANPLTTPPPYTVRAVSRLFDGSSTTYEVGIDVVSLLDFAVFSEGDINISSNITIDGRLYAGDDINLTGPNIEFLQRVEYVDQLFNPGFGTFRQGNEQVSPLPALSTLVDLTLYENASKNAGVCTAGRGLYLGFDGTAAVDAQTTALFWRTVDGTSDPDQPGCRTAGQCAVIDLTLFDFSVSPITYSGVPLIGFDAQPLVDFSGVIFSDAEVHVWGHLGGRSPEEVVVTDTHNYMSPPTMAVNLYSDNTLGVGEDGTGGGNADGLLDPAARGMSVGVYTDEEIYIDHNIFMGTTQTGGPVRLGLVADGYIRVDSYSPRMILIEAAVLSGSLSWRPAASAESDHNVNDWADQNGDLPGGNFIYDLNGDGILENNNGGPPGDRNENSMKNAWTLRNEGNLVIATPPSSGVWSANGHPRFYNYDSGLRTAEIPCYPNLPNFVKIPGTFTEILTEP